MGRINGQENTKNQHTHTELLQKVGEVGMTIEEWAKDFKSYVNELDMPRDDYNGIMEYIDDALALLKEQEAKSIIRKQCKREYPDGAVEYFAEWHCPHCDSPITCGFDAPWIKHCCKCGKPILWGGR